MAKLFVNFYFILVFKQVFYIGSDKTLFSLKYALVCPQKYTAWFNLQAFSFSGKHQIKFAAKFFFHSARNCTNYTTQMQIYIHSVSFILDTIIYLFIFSSTFFISHFQNVLLLFIISWTLIMQRVRWKVCFNLTWKYSSANSPT